MDSTINDDEKRTEGKHQLEMRRPGVILVKNKPPAKFTVILALNFDPIPSPE